MVVLKFDLSLAFSRLLTFVFCYLFQGLVIYISTEPKFMIILKFGRITFLYVAVNAKPSASLCQSSTPSLSYFQAFYFETGSHYVPQACPKLVTLLPLPPTQLRLELNVIMCSISSLQIQHYIYMSVNIKFHYVQFVTNSLKFSQLFEKISANIRENEFSLNL